MAYKKTKFIVRNCDFSFFCLHKIASFLSCRLGTWWHLFYTWTQTEGDGNMLLAGKASDRGLTVYTEGTYFSDTCGKDQFPFLKNIQCLDWHFCFEPCSETRCTAHVWMLPHGGMKVPNVSLSFSPALIEASRSHFEQQWLSTAEKHPSPDTSPTPV